MSSPSGIWSSRSGSTRLSPSLLGVSSTARMSDVAVSCRQMYLAPSAPALNTMFAGLPLPIAKELDARAVNEQVQGPVGAPIRDLDLQGLLTSAPQQHTSC